MGDGLASVATPCAENEAEKRWAHEHSPRGQLTKCRVYKRRRQTGRVVARAATPPKGSLVLP